MKRSVTDVDLVNRLLACGADPNLKGESKKVALNRVVIKVDGS